MAWDYEDQDNEPEKPGLFGTGDYSWLGDDDELRQQARQHALRQDLIPDDYKPKTFGQNFRDNFRSEMNKNTKGALGNAERGEGAKTGVGNKGRDIGKQERGSAKSP